jgi:uncharacterized protein (DUF1778 family)
MLAGGSRNWTSGVGVPVALVIGARRRKRRSGLGSFGSSRLRKRAVRDVLAIRLSDAERRQIQLAAARLGLSLSGFIREASLQASAVVDGKVSVKAPEPEPEREPLALAEPVPVRVHYVDGEPVRR